MKYGVIFFLVLSSIVLAESLFAQSEIIENQCDVNQLKVRTTIINPLTISKNITVSYFMENSMVVKSYTIEIAPRSQKSVDDIISFSVPYGSHTLYTKILTDDDIITKSSTFVFVPCDLYGLGNTGGDIKSMLHKRVPNTDYEVWQIFGIIFMFTAIILYKIGKPFGKKNTIKILVSLVISLIIIGLMLSIAK